MLEVVLNMVPFGIESKRRRLFTIKIANMGIPVDGSPLCNYRVRTINEKGNEINHGILVRDFDSKQPQSAYILVSKVADALKNKGALQ